MHILCIWYSTVLANCVAQSTHVCIISLAVRGAPWWVLSQHSIMLRWFLSEVSCNFCAPCMYSKFGHHPHPLGYLCAKFCFFCGLHCWAARGEKSRTQSLTQLIWCPGNTSEQRTNINNKVKANSTFDISIYYIVLRETKLKEQRWTCLSAEQDTPMPTGQDAPCRGKRTTLTSWQKYLPPNCAPMPSFLVSSSTCCSSFVSRKPRPCSLPETQYSAWQINCAKPA